MMGDGHDIVESAQTYVPCVNRKKMKIMFVFTENAQTINNTFRSWKIYFKTQFYHSALYGCVGFTFSWLRGPRDNARPFDPGLLSFAEVPRKALAIIKHTVLNWEPLRRRVDPG